MDITATLEAKSSQLNTDDLIAAARTITITKVSAGSAEQPVAVSFENDGGKPWYPCKSMRRVLVAAWGADAAQYVGRRVTLFRDPSVVYGGIAVGGIRVSHLSHLDGPLSIALTMTRQKRTPYKVQPLPAAPAAPAPVAAPPTEDLVAQADAACRRSGLTDAGIAAFVLEYSQGSTSDLKDAPPDVLTRIAKQGISPQTVEKFNPAPAAAEPEPKPAPVSQPAPIDATATSSEPEPVEPGTVERLPQGRTVIAADPQPEPAPAPAPARRVVPQVRRSAPAAPPADEAPIPDLVD